MTTESLCDAPESAAREVATKEARVRELLAARGLDALVLRRVSSFAWATAGGASYVNAATDEGAATLLYTPSGRYVLTNNIEAARLADEQGLGTQGWQSVVSPWHAPDDAVARLTRGMRVGADGPGTAADLSGDVARLRMHLLPSEGARFGALGRACADAMRAAIEAVRPGQTEHAIAGLLAREAHARGVLPIVDLVATDERVARYRHPLPTGRTLERLAMLVLCGRRHGLVCSITRLVHFGAIPDELRRRQDALAGIDATILAATRPGATIGQAFDAGVAAYGACGFGDEWRLHHQGGAAGYEPREVVATSDSREIVEAGQAFAWNPSITGTKSEDTVLVTADGPPEVLTAMAGWPTIGVTLAGASFARPAILEVT